MPEGSSEALSLKKVQVLDREEFEEVWWPVVDKALGEVPRMFQVWVCKQVTGVADEIQSKT